MVLTLFELLLYYFLIPMVFWSVCIGGIIGGMLILEWGMFIDSQNLG